MDRIPRFLSVLERLGRAADLTVATAAEWRLAEGSPLHREVVTHELRLHPSLP